MYKVDFFVVKLLAAFDSGISVIAETVYPGNTVRETISSVWG